MQEKMNVFGLLPAIFTCSKPVLPQYWGTSGRVSEMRENGPYFRDGGGPQGDGSKGKDGAGRYRT